MVQHSYSSSYQLELMLLEQYAKQYIHIVTLYITLVLWSNIQTPYGMISKIQCCLAAFGYVIPMCTYIRETLLFVVSLGNDLPLKSRYQPSGKHNSKCEALKTATPHYKGHACSAWNAKADPERFEKTIIRWIPSELTPVVQVLCR